MDLTASRGIKGPQWLSNMILRSDDINFSNQSQYQNMADKASMEAQADLTGGNSVVLSGLILSHDTVMTCELQTGDAVSSEGTYYETDSWGFFADTDQAFYVVAPVATPVAFNVGDASNPRIDILEIRPIQNTYNQESRQFKDPLTSSITSALTNTRIEHGFEFQIVEGTPAASPVAPSKTAGWVKLAEVSIAQSATSITDSEIDTYSVSSTWTTEASKTIPHPFLAQITADIADLAGVGRTTETVKDNQDDVVDLAGVGRTTETVKDNQDDVVDLAGTGRTTETVKDNADAIGVNGGDIDDLEGHVNDGLYTGTSIDVTGEVEGGSLDINGAADIAGAVTGVTTLTASGELQGGSLDINGNADISGNLTGVDALTASGKITGAELEGTSLDINGAADISGALTGVDSIACSGDVTADNLLLNVQYPTFSTYNFNYAMDSNWVLPKGIHYIRLWVDGHSSSGSMSASASVDIQASAGVWAQMCRAFISLTAIPDETETEYFTCISDGTNMRVRAYLTETEPTAYGQVTVSWYSIA